MKMNRAKEGAIVLNKLTGHEYKVTERCGEKAKAQRILEKDPVVLSLENVIITEKNAICFRVLIDAEPEMPEGYSVENGILMKDDKSVTEQGELYIEEIVHCWKGKLLLTVRASEGYVKLYIYEPHRDRFSKPYGEEIPSPQIMLRDELVFLSYSGNKEVTEENADGNPETKIVFDKAGFLVFTDGKVSDKYEFSSEIKDCILSDDKNEQAAVFILENETKAFQIKDGCIAAKTELDINNIEICNLCHALSGGFEVRSSDKFIYQPEHEDPISFTSKSVLNEIRKYNHLIEASFPDRYTMDLMFANDNYDIKVVTIKRTKDRGVIVNVKDFE